ncbi:MAG: NADP-dependent oxidoreductase [Chloroflexota bacterium]
MPNDTNREIHLKSRPTGMPTAENFELVSISIPEPKSGEVLVRNIYMSVDPYMRGRMIDRKSYTPPFQLGEPLAGGCVGQIVTSNGSKFQPGDFVLGMLGWREYYVSAEKYLTKIDPSLAPLQSFLGTMGMPGQTAYIGLLDIGQPKEGETVFVSAASGAVGAIVCQIAKIKGCRVVGSAGSEKKVAWLKEVAGVDAAFNYKTVGKISDELAKLCPNGIDVYFENVGGEHLEAAITHMNPFGRISLCGMISQYNNTQPTPGPNNLIAAVGKRLRLQGFIVSDHQDRLPDFYTDMAKWIADGKIKWEETILDGIDQAPEAFMGLFKGENMGKMIVKLGDDPTL